jgi:hypothetical protein
MSTEIENVFFKLGEAVKNNPFDFFKENDVTCFLYQHFIELFPTRVKVRVDPDVEKYNVFNNPSKMMCGRVHTEIKFPDSLESIDMAILEDRDYQIYAKSQNMVGGFMPPFMCGIEIKLAHGSKTGRFSKKAVPYDIEKLSKFSSKIKYSYAILVDFFENRSESQIDILRKTISENKNVRCFYASIDKYLMIK